VVFIIEGNSDSNFPAHLPYCKKTFTPVHYRVMIQSPSESQFWVCPLVSLRLSPSPRSGGARRGSTFWKVGSVFDVSPGPQISMIVPPPLTNLLRYCLVFPCPPFINSC